MTFHVNESMKKLTIESINWDEFATNPFSNTAWAPYLSIHPKRKQLLNPKVLDKSPSFILKLSTRICLNITM